MNSEAQRITIAEACGYIFDDYSGKKKSIIGWKKDGKYISILPDYLNDLNAMHEAEKILQNEKYSIGHSSNSHDHASARYMHFLCEIVGLKTREELVISCSEEDRGKLNFRPDSYPTPIQLPQSAIVLGHSIPGYGYESELIMATAAQKAEALLKTINLWNFSN